MSTHWNSLSLKKKIGQLFFIGFSGTDVDSATCELMDEIAPGGICLFARNIREAGQTRVLLDELRTQLPFKPFLSVDQEGGMVDRLKRLMTSMPAANRIITELEAGELATLMAETLRILGFNMNFAPVVDVVNTQRAKYTNGLYSRTFGESKDQTTDVAGEFLRVMQSNGVMGCLKHFPGLGASRVDSHEELPIVEIIEEELFSIDIFPYRKLLREANAVMVGHAGFPNVNLQEKDQNGKLLPSSLSYNFVTTLLRCELAFDGLVITDDLEMGAIIRNYGIGDACKMAVSAGVDMLAICADPKMIIEGRDSVLKAVNNGEISIDRIEMSLSRIAIVKNKLFLPLKFDPDRIKYLSGKIAELNEQLGR